MDCKGKVKSLRGKGVVFLMCDVQQNGVDKFISEPARFIKNCNILLECANILKRPVIVAEHHTTKYGSTHTEVKETLNKCTHRIFNKQTWSMITPELYEEISCFTTVVLFGIEGHLCVLNTAIDLINEGFTVFFVDDAIRSERENDRLVGVKRMEMIGCIPCTVESCVYEICEREGELFEKLRTVLDGLKKL
jgi:nicotinamidase-related amidase